jgi:hypothetical protein
VGKVFEDIDDRLAAFIGAQHLFFVATAPLTADGHVNLSPKGLASFAILGPRRVAYLDLVGSAAETIAHARENGRIVFMFCAFEGPPRIVRLHGRARAVEPGDADFEELAAPFDTPHNTRAIVVADLERISDSCGYGVPLMSFEAEREQLPMWADRKGAAGVVAYQLENNLESLDGLPALRAEKLRNR